MPRIGHYLKRGTRWHLVESQITDRYVTRCGRKMRRNLSTRGPVEVITDEQFADMPSNELCYYCRVRHQE